MAPSSPSILRLLGFAAPALPLAGLAMPLYLLLPTVYAERSGLAIVGILLLVARLWDAITDPLIGWASDRYSLIVGRRKGWMAVGTVILIPAILLLFDPPAQAGAGWMFGWSLLLYLGWTMVQVPYAAFAAEAVSSYHDRTRIVAYREGAVIVGTVLASALPSVTGTPSQALAWLGWGMAALLVPTMVIACRAFPEPALSQKRTAAGGWRLLIANQPFRALILAYFLNGIANGLPATLFFLYVAHRLKAPAIAGPLLLLYFAAGLLSVPVWLALSRRIGKLRAWRLGLLGACLAFAATPFLQAGDTLAFAAVCLTSGLALGADLLLPPALQADVVEEDRLRVGTSRAGLYFALWAMATKLALALAVGIAFPLLDLSGFQASDAAASTLMLALLYGGAPILFKLAVLLCLSGYRLDDVARTITGDLPCDPSPSSSPLSSSLPGATR